MVGCRLAPHEFGDKCYEKNKTNHLISRNSNTSATAKKLYIKISQFFVFIEK